MQRLNLLWLALLFEPGPVAYKANSKQGKLVIDSFMVGSIFWRLDVRMQGVVYCSRCAQRPSPSKNGH